MGGVDLLGVCLACGMATPEPRHRRFIAEGSPLIVPLCDDDAADWRKAPEKTRADQLTGQDQADARTRVAFVDWLDRRRAEWRSVGVPPESERARLEALATEAGLPLPREGGAVTEFLVEIVIELAARAVRWARKKWRNRKTWPRRVR